MAATLSATPKPPRAINTENLSIAAIEAVASTVTDPSVIRRTVGRLVEQQDYFAAASLLLRFDIGSPQSKGRHLADIARRLIKRERWVHDDLIPARIVCRLGHASGNRAVRELSQRASPPYEDIDWKEWERIMKWTLDGEGPTLIQMRGIEFANRISRSHLAGGLPRLEQYGMNFFRSQGTALFTVASLFEIRDTPAQYFDSGDAHSFITGVNHAIASGDLQLSTFLRFWVRTSWELPYERRNFPHIGNMAWLVNTFEWRGISITPGYPDSEKLIAAARQKTARGRRLLVRLIPSKQSEGELEKIRPFELSILYGSLILGFVSSGSTLEPSQVLELLLKRTKKPNELDSAFTALSLALPTSKGSTREALLLALEALTQKCKKLCDWD